MLRDRFDGAVVVEGRNDPDTLARLSPTGEWRVGAFEITRLDDDELAPQDSNLDADQGAALKDRRLADVVVAHQAHGARYGTVC